MYIEGLTHVAIDVASPTRMERFLREVFGLQTLRHGYWKGDYIRVMGSPDPELANPGFVYLHLRPGIPEGRLNHIGFNVVGQDVQSAVDELQGRGIYVDVDGDDMLYGPEDLRIQVDSSTRPRPVPDDPTIQMIEDPRLDPELPCMIRGIHHAAPDVAVPTRMEDWLCNTFGLDGKRRRFARRGEYISSVSYENAPRDVIGRKPGLLPLFFRPGLTRVRLNHIAFEVDDAVGAIDVIEAKGVKVDLAGDAMIHGPEGIWFQLDSRKTPYPVGHPANDPGVRLTD